MDRIICYDETNGVGNLCDSFLYVNKKDPVYRFYDSIVVMFYVAPI